MRQRLEWSCRTGSLCSEATQPSKRTQNRGHEEQKVKLLHTAPIMGRFPALRQFQQCPEFPFGRSGSCGGIVLLDSPEGWRGSAGDVETGRPWVLWVRGSKSAPCFGIRRGETRSSRPSCDTNSAETRCSGVVSVLQPDWLRWEDARSRRCAAHGRSTAEQSPQSMRAKRQVGWRRVYLFTW